MQRKGDIAAAYIVIPDTIEADWLSAWPPLSRPSFLQEMIDRRHQAVRVYLPLSPRQDMSSKVVGKKKVSSQAAPKKKTQAKEPCPLSMAEEGPCQKETSLAVERRDEDKEERVTGKVPVQNEETIEAADLGNTTLASEDEAFDAPDTTVSARFEAGRGAGVGAIEHADFEFVYPRGVIY